MNGSNDNRTVTVEKAEYIKGKNIITFEQNANLTSPWCLSPSSQSAAVLYSNVTTGEEQISHCESNFFNFATSIRTSLNVELLIQSGSCPLWLFRDTTFCCCSVEDMEWHCVVRLNCCKVVNPRFITSYWSCSNTAVNTYRRKNAPMDKRRNRCLGGVTTL